MLRAIGSGSEDPFVWSKAALLCLKRGDGAAYATLRSDLLREYADLSDPWESNALAYICSLGSGDAADSRRVAHCRRVVATSPREYSFRNTLGAALYRAGEFAQSVHELEEGIKVHGKGGGHSDWLFLSMAYHGLGRDADARRWLEEVNRQGRQTVQPREEKIPALGRATSSGDSSRRGRETPLGRPTVNSSRHSAAVTPS